MIPSHTYCDVASSQSLCFRRGFAVLAMSVRDATLQFLLPTGEALMRNLAKAFGVSAVFCLALCGIASTAFAEQLWAPCKPLEAAAYANRIHVKCASAVDGRFWYFAAPTTEPAPVW